MKALESVNEILVSLCHHMEESARCAESGDTEKALEISSHASKLLRSELSKLLGQFSTPKRVTNGGRVSLHNAFFWTCDSCGRDNFVRSVKMDAVDQADLIYHFMQQSGLDEVPKGMESAMISYPKLVRCDYCLSEYKSGVGDLDDDPELSD